ncbi:MAG: ABC-F family ATP-binding cassette domain-containing protein [Thermoanaerobaculia bacterium]
MIAVSALEKAYGTQTLFTGVSFQLKPGNRYGLVGANGSGKSTLLRILSGDEPASDGTVSIPKRLRLGVLSQDHYSYENLPILDTVLMGNEELWAAMVEKERILARADEEFDAERYAELEDVVLHHDGYSVEAQAGEILEGLGIPAEVHRNDLSTLSGGFKLRVLLAQVLAAKPQALLLDEPTNHLDILSIRWLEKFLQGFAGTAVIISHDHRFLDNVCSHILDVDYDTVTLYTGDYTAFVAGKQAERERKQKEQSKREKEIAHHQAFVDRFRAKATKARQAQSKLRLIEKRQSELEPLAQSSRRYPTFRFPQRRPSGKEVLKLEGVSKAYGDNRVLSDVSLTIRRGQRLAILGPNGIGKSTLLKIAMGDVEADAGEIEWGYETHPGYFAQDHREQLTSAGQSVEAFLWEACPGENIGVVRARLGQVLFSKDEVRKKLGALSGGEATRLIFARLTVDEPNVLVLDEPTNHLDLEAIEALVEGLKGYEGTLILVSHDRWFVSELADHIVEITGDGLRTYDGSYDEYVAWCGDDHLDVEAVLKVKREKKRAERRKGGKGKRERRLAQRHAEITEAIDTAEKRIREIDARFAEPGYFDRAPRSEVRQLESEQARLKEELDRLMTEWEEAEEALAGVEG